MSHRRLKNQMNVRDAAATNSDGNRGARFEPLRKTGLSQLAADLPRNVGDAIAGEMLADEQEGLKLHSTILKLFAAV